MEEKKIRYPFKNFVKNIIVGIVLMLSVFLAMPIINNFSNNVGGGDNVNAASTAKVRVYGYYDNDIREIESTDWWYTWPFSKTTKYQYGSSEHRRVYYTEDLSINSMSNKVENALQRDFDVPAGKKIKFVPQNNQTFHIVGIFKGKGQFSTSYIYEMGDTASLQGGETYSILVCDDNYKITMNIDKYLYFNDRIKWKSSSYTSGYSNSSETINMGASKALRGMTPKIDSTSDFNSALYIGDKILEKDNNDSRGEPINYFWYLYGYKHGTNVKWVLCGYAKVGINNFSTAVFLGSKDENESFVLSGMSATINIEWRFTPTEINNKFSFNKTNGQVTFNIYNSLDLSNFAEEVNAGFLNKTTSNYRAVLQNDILSYTGDPIGKNSGDGAFKGEFDGDSKKIGTARINPIYGHFIDNSTIKDENSNFVNVSILGISRFGFFGHNSETGVIKNLTIDTVTVGGKGSYLKPSGNYHQTLEDFLNDNQLQPYEKKEKTTMIAWFDGYDRTTPESERLTPTKLSALCAVNMGTISGIKIGSCKLNIELLGSGISSGAIAAEMTGGSVYDCSVDLFQINVGGFNNSSTTVNNDYNLGGIAGYISGNSSITDATIKEYNVNPNVNTNNDKVWGKHDANNFYAGGIVGRQENSVLSDCHVNGGTQNFTGVYHTNVVAIGGISGLAQNSHIIESSSKNVIKVDGMSGGGSGNKNEDYFCVGGIAGITRGTYIDLASYDISGGVVLRSGVKKGEFQLWYNARYGVYFGGLIGSCEGSTQGAMTQIYSSYVHIQNGVDFSGKVMEYLGFGLFTGKQTDEAEITNCYSVIGNDNNATYINNGINNGINYHQSSYGLFGSQSGKVTLTDCYWVVKKVNTNLFAEPKDMNCGGLLMVDQKVDQKNISIADKLNQLFASSSGLSIYNGKNEKGVEEIVQIGDYFDITNEKKVFAYNASGGIDKTWTEHVIEPVYGYNSSIQSNWVDRNTAGPFLLSNYTLYKNVLIDFTKWEDDLSLYGGISTNGFIYSTNGKFKYIYGTHVDSAEFTLPRLKKIINGLIVPCVYSLYPTGYNEKGELDTFESIDSISYGNTTIYPVWINNDAVTIYSPVSLKVFNKTDFKLITNGVTGDIKINEETVSFMVKGGTVNSEFYTHKYSITCSKANVTITKEILHKIFSLNFGNTAPNVQWVANGNIFSNNDYTYDKDNNVFRIEYVNGTAFKDFSGYTTDDKNFNFGGTYYIHVYNPIDFYQGKTDTSVSEQPVSGKYLTLYEKYQTLPLFITSKNDGCVVSFDGFKNIPGFGDLEFNGEKTWGALGKVEIETDLSDLMEDVDVDGKTKHTFSKHETGYIEYTQSWYKGLRSSSAIYPLYTIQDQEKPPIPIPPGNKLIIEYYNDVRQKSSYEDVIELREGITVYDAFHGLNDDSEWIKTYNYSKLGFTKRYDFVGWELSTSNFGSFRVYTEMTFAVPDTWFETSKTIHIKLYPLFVNKNGVSVEKEVRNASENLISTTIDGVPYYIVSTPADLIYCTYLINFERETYYDMNLYIANNIDMSGYKNLMPIGVSFDACGGYSSVTGYKVRHMYFAGNIYGGHNLISNLTLEGKPIATRIALAKDATDATNLNIYYSPVMSSTNPLYNTSYIIPNIGFVDYAYGATIRDVNLINVNFSQSTNSGMSSTYNANCCGGIAAKASANETTGLQIKNCLVSGRIYAGGDQGGIVGNLNRNASEDVIIKECTTNATFNTSTTGYAVSGTIVGRIGNGDKGKIYIDSCFDTCSEKDVSNSGLYKYGFIGGWGNDSGGNWGNGVTIAYCYTTTGHMNVTKDQRDTGRYEIKGKFVGNYGVSGDYSTIRGNSTTIDSFLTWEAPLGETSSIKGTVWAVDEKINSGKLYLVNTGMIYKDIVLTANSLGEKYIFTPEDEEKFANILGAKKATINSNAGYKVNTKHFILDIAPYYYDKNGYAITDATTLTSKLNEYYEKYLKELSRSGEIVNSLEGYNFVNYYITNYTGTLTDVNAKVVDFLLYGNGKIFCDFAPKTIKVKYKVAMNEQNASTNYIECEFGDEISVEALDIFSLSQSLLNLLQGKMINSFKLYLPQKNIYLKIQNGKLAYCGSYSKNYYTRLDASTLTFGETFVVSLIDKENTSGEYVLEVVIDESTCEDVEYMLGFYKSSSDISGLKAFVYDADSNTYSVDLENGNINYFIAKYGDVLFENNISMFPEIEAIGMTFEGWGFYDASGNLIPFWTKTKAMTMPDLRFGIYANSASLFDDNCYMLELYPIGTKASYEITYYDGFGFDKTGSDVNLSVITYHSPKLCYDDNVTIYSKNILSNYALVKSHTGHYISKFSFKKSTINAINSLSEEAKEAVLQSVQSYASKYGIKLLLTDTLDEKCIKVINYLYNNNIEFNYFIPLNIGLICEYVKDDVSITINLTNSDNIDMYYSITDSETDETGVAEMINFANKTASFKVKYGSVVTIYTSLRNGTKINSITNNASKTEIYSFTSFGTSAEKFAKEILPQIREFKVGKAGIGVVENVSINFNIESLVTNELQKDDDGYYMISSESDLVEYANNVAQKDYDKVKLTTNLNITGLKVYIPETGNVFDGCGYTINGFTSFASDIKQLTNSNYSNNKNITFIGTNYGTIKNVNFDNICVNINSSDYTYYAIIESNYGTIENVNILGGQIIVNSASSLSSSSPSCLVSGLVGYNNNNCMVGNVSVNLNITVSGQDIYGAGLVCGLNSGSISNFVVNGNVSAETNLNTKYSIYFGFVVGINYNGTISAGVIDTTYVGIVNIIVGCELSGKPTELYQGIVYYGNAYKWSNLANTASQGYSTCKKLSKTATLQTLLSAKQTTFAGFDSLVVVGSLNANSYEFKVKDVNIQLVDINISADVNDELKTRITQKVNSKEVLTNNILIYIPLANRFTFNETTYQDSLQLYAINLELLEQNKQINSLFDIYSKQNDSQEEKTSKVYVSSLRQTKTDSVMFRYQTAVCSKFSFNLSYDSQSKFTKEEIKLIQDGIKVYINKSKNPNPVSLVFNEDGSVILTDGELNIVQICYFDQIEIDFDLPSFALLSSTGITLNSNKIADSVKQQKYNYVLTVTQNSDYRVNADFERGKTVLVLDLNLDKISNETEKSKISFNDNFITSILKQKYGLNAEINSLNQLEIEIEAQSDGTKFVYALPNLIDELNSSIISVISYENNGINYLFKGFVDSKNQYYYNQNFEKQKTEILQSLTLFAKFDAVQYKVIVDNLDGKCYFTNLNGYASASTRTVQKTIKFGDSMTVPNPKMNSVGYKFVGYQIKNGPTISVALTNANEEVISQSFVAGYETLNQNYTIYDENKTNEIFLTPIFEETEFTLTFESGKFDEFETYLYFAGSEDVTKYQTIKIENLTISKILDEQFTMPQGYKLHGEFLGFALKDSSDNKLVIKFENNKFVYDALNLIGNKTFVAVYKTQTVQVEIVPVDINTGKNLAFSVVDGKDVEEYTIKNGKIVFNVAYGTTNLELPSIKLANEDYLFESYVVGNETYLTSYVFTQDTEINITNKYKVTFETKGGEIKNSYSLFERLSRNENQYVMFAEYNENIILPTAEEVLREGFTLKALKLNNIAITGLTVQNPAVIDFEYEGNMYELTLDASGAEVPNAFVSEYIESYEKTGSSEAKLKVAHGTDVQALGDALKQMNLNLDGYTFQNFEFSETTDKIVGDGQIKANFVQNNYTIEIYDNDGQKLAGITKHYQDAIESSFFENVISDCKQKGESLGLTFNGLSLSTDNFEEFEIISIMPMLEKEYGQAEQTNNEIVLKLYANYSIKKLNVVIKTKDINTNKLQEFEVLNLFGLDGIDASISSTEIKFVVNYGTTNLELPSIKLANDDYLFESYVVGNETYLTSYVFTQDTEINITNKYKVTFETKGGEIKNSYSLFERLSRNENQYVMFAEYNENIILPTAEEVLREGFTLKALKLNNIAITGLTVQNPAVIDFEYEGNMYELTLDASGAKVPNAFVSEYIESYEKTGSSEAKLKVAHGTDVQALSDALKQMNLNMDGYTFQNFEFSETTDKIVCDGQIKANFVQNNYTIEIYDNDGQKLAGITKHYQDAIESSFFEDIKNACITKANNNGLNFVGFSLKNDVFEEFIVPAYMPLLEQYSTTNVVDNNYNLSLYCYYNIAKVNVVIKTKDINTNKLQEFEVLNLFGLEDIETEITATEIKFVVNYGTTNLELPSIKLANEDYLFESYVVGNETYLTSYVFTQDTEINITNKYKVTFETKGGEIKNSYSLFDKLVYDNNNYYFYESYNTQLKLPTKTDVEKIGFTLSGFKVNGVEIINLVVANVCVVSFEYTGNTYVLSLDAEEFEAILPASINGNVILSYNLISAYKAEITVAYGTKIVDIENVLPKLSSNGYTFVGYKFSETGDKIVGDGQIKANFVQNNYTIEIYDNDGQKLAGITKHYQDAIESSFFENVISDCKQKGESLGLTFNGLSLSTDNFEEFEIISIMPMLEKEYEQAEQTNNEIVLKLYANYSIKKLNVVIKTKDINTNKLQEFDLLNLNGLEDIETEITATEIKFVVNYGTTNLELPSIKLANEDYLFESYVVGNETYLTSYVFTQDTEINITNKYKVTFETKGGEIKNSYEHFGELSQQEYNYYLFAEFNKQISLPNIDEVSRSGFTLVGFKIDGEIVENALTISGPVVVEFVYDGNVITLSLDSSAEAVNLPQKLTNLAFIESYELVDEYHATIKVKYGSRVSDVKTCLPKLEKVGYTLVDYVFSQQDVLTLDGNIVPQFVKNQYKIVAFDANGTQIVEIIKYFDEAIEDSFYAQIKNYCETIAKQNNAFFKGISLNKDSFVEFDCPSTMPMLNNEYQNVVQTGYIYTLNVYGYYFDKVNVTIVANENSLISNENTLGLENFVGGNAYNQSANFNISIKNINSKQVRLPIPQIDENSILKFGKFVGYYVKNDNIETLVVDEFGKLLDEFKPDREIVLYQKFENINVNFEIFATFDSVKDNELYGFEKITQGFKKSVEFGTAIGNLPITMLENYNFVGWYLSDNNDITKLSKDIKIADENGILVAGYENLTNKYFVEGSSDIVLKNICAKYEIKMLEVVIKTNNNILGEVNAIVYSNGAQTTYKEVENGFACNVISGKDILISANNFENRGTFKNWKVYLDGEDVTETVIKNATNQSVIIKNVSKNYEIVAIFEEIFYTITYYNDEEVLSLTPNSYSILTENFDLPQAQAYGKVFAGWYLEKEFINKRTSINPVEYLRNLNLFAKFENVGTKINIYSNNINGYELYSSVNVVYGAQIETLPSIVLENYNFVGFFTNQDATGIKIDNSSLNIFVEETNVYAYFTPKIANILQGVGTMDKPYLIATEQDFMCFAQMANSMQLNERTYFKLANSIEISTQVVINSFNANFDGDNNVIYINNALGGYNTLTSDGKVVKNVSLFGTNVGTIKNLTVCVNQNGLDDLLDEQNSKIDYAVNLNIISNNNNGVIDNIITYFNINLPDIKIDDANLLDIICKNQQATDYSVYNSVLITKNGQKDYNDVIDKHLLSKNVIAPSVNENGEYIISSVEEFGYILSLNETEIKIVLNDNINLKGKIFEKLDKKLSINANGYIISNIMALNQNYLFDSLSLNMTAIENVIFMNFFANNLSLILNSDGIENSYITTSLTNLSYIVLNNNQKTSNSYFVSNKNLIFAKNNNADIANVYLINVEKFETNNAQIQNVVSLTDKILEDVEKFVSDAKEINETNGKTNLWFVDKNMIMSDYVLPQLIKVGNVVTELVYNKQYIDVYAEIETTNDNLIITKQIEDIMLSVYVVDYNQNVSDIIVNNQSRIDEFDYVLKMFRLNNQTSNYNIVEFVTSLNKYSITIKVNNQNSGNMVKFEENVGETITFLVDGGTQFNSLNIETICGAGFKFVGFEFVAEEGYYVDQTNPIVDCNLLVYANFEEQVVYELDLRNYSGIIVKDTKLEDYWTEIETGLYQIYLAKSENVDDYLPNISKQDYIFKNYYKVEFDEYNFKVFPQFSADYVVINLNFDNTKNEITISGKEEFSRFDSSLKVCNKDEELDIYYVLRGYEIVVTITFNGNYLTRFTLNEEDLFDDYSIFVNNEDTISLDIEPNKLKDSNDIFVSFENILIETKFEFDNEFASIKLKNATIDPITFITKTNKNENLIFELSVIDGKTLDGLEFVYEDSSFTPTYSEKNGVYSYLVQKAGTIKIKLKDKMVNVVVNFTDGGSVESAKRVNKTIIDEHSYSFEVEYGKSIKMLVMAYDGYKLSSISTSTGKNFELKPSFEIENLKDDVEINVAFTKFATWLDIDENNNPKYFNLSKFYGNGTENNPYIISNIYDFLTIAYNINILNKDYSGVYFKAARRDLELDFSRYYFVPINNFNGTILGDNLTLSGIKIISNSYSALFRKLDANAFIKSINISGEISGNYFVGGIAGENNGTILGCSNNAVIENINNHYDQTNITGGICAVNNGLISRCFNSKQIDSESVYIGGICAINNGEIDNVYNKAIIYSSNNYDEASVAAGICAQNNGTIKIGYNDARVINKSYNQNIEIVGTVKNLTGTYEDLYFNKNKISIDSLDARSYEEMLNNENAIYANFDKDIWLFATNKLPVLKTMYEYIGSISITITFDETLKAQERMVYFVLTNEIGQNYGVIIDSSNKIYQITSLSKGEYKITLKTLLGSSVSISTNTELTLDETVGENVEIKITLSKTNSKGYYGYVII